MTWPVINDAHVIPDAMLARLKERGPIIIVHLQGEFAKTNGALFTTALVALPGETSDECLARHGMQTDADDFVFNFAFKPIF
jgi:hypothetical protein